MEELYFCLYLTENEHDIIKNNLNEQAKKLDCKLKYYRKLKEGHILMYREVKFIGIETSINHLKNWISTEQIDKHIVRNPHKLY